MRKYSKCMKTWYEASTSSYCSRELKRRLKVAHLVGVVGRPVRVSELKRGILTTKTRGDTEHPLCTLYSF